MKALESARKKKVTSTGSIPKAQLMAGVKITNNLFIHFFLCNIQLQKVPGKLSQGSLDLEQFSKPPN